MGDNKTLGMRTNASFPSCFDSPEQRIVKVFAFVILLVVALCGNCIVCLIVRRNTNMRNTMNYLLVNMAISDLVIPILVAVKAILEMSTGNDEWRVKGIIGQLLCKLFYFLSDMSPIVSILSLVLISFDRFVAIVLPFKAAYFPERSRKCLIAMTWILAVLFCCPYFYFLGVNKFERCSMQWQAGTRRVYTVIVTVLFIILPFSILIFMYTCILYKIKTRPTDLNQTEGGKKRRKASKRNITLLSFTVVLMFGVCWGPYFAVLMLINFSKSLDYCNFRNFIFTVQFLAYSNAAINPLLYFVFLKNFRAGLDSLFSSSPCSQHRVYDKEHSGGRRSSATVPLSTKTTKNITAIEMQESEDNGNKKRDVKV